MSKSVACIISDSGTINLFVNGKPYVINKDHSNYKRIVDALNAQDYSNIEDLIDIPKAIESFTAGHVTVSGDSVLYDGQAVHSAISTRILNLMRENLPFQFMINFLENLMQNPSFRAVNELYGFLEFANIPITDDGCFLAYKKVRNNYMDIYSGTISNKVGEKPFMFRNAVDEDKDRTCSNGLHFCSLQYIPQFGSGEYDGGDRVMIVKINPADVVAIPADYNNTKGRCCKYEVVAEYEGDWRKDAFTKPVHNSDGTPYEFDDDHDDSDDFYGDYVDDDDLHEQDDLDDQDDVDAGRRDNPLDLDNELGVKPNGQGYYNVRDAKGQFVKRESN